MDGIFEINANALLRNKMRDCGRLLQTFIESVVLSKNDCFVTT